MDKESNSSILTEALRSIYGPIVKQSAKWPPVLAYGVPCIVTALLIVLIRPSLPDTAFWLVLVLVLAPLLGYILSDWDKRRQDTATEMAKLEIGAVITGNVLFEDGFPAKDAVVTVDGLDRKRESDENGWFQIEVRDQGEWTVRARYENQIVQSTITKNDIQKPIILMMKRPQEENFHDKDIELLRQHRKIFDRPAFRVSCIDELFLQDVSEAVDDAQAALNVGTLYSRSNKLLRTFPTKDDYKSDDFVHAFEEISDDLVVLKRQLETLQIELNINVFKAEPDLAALDTTHLVISIAELGDRNLVRKVLQQMDEVDATRNRILGKLNQLAEKSGEKSFPLMVRTTDKLRKPDSLYSTIAGASVAKYLD